jgi:hypothetical protein
MAAGRFFNTLACLQPPAGLLAGRYRRLSPH